MAKKKDDGLTLREIGLKSLATMQDNDLIEFAVKRCDVEASEAKSFMFRCFGYKTVMHENHELAVSKVPVRYIRRFMELFPEVTVYEWGNYASNG